VERGAADWLGLDPPRLFSRSKRHSLRATERPRGGARAGCSARGTVSSARSSPRGRLPGEGSVALIPCCRRLGRGGGQGRRLGERQELTSTCIARLRDWCPEYFEEIRWYRLGSMSSGDQPVAFAVLNTFAAAWISDNCIEKHSPCLLGCPSCAERFWHPWKCPR